MLVRQHPLGVHVCMCVSSSGTSTASRAHGDPGWLSASSSAMKEGSSAGGSLGSRDTPAVLGRGRRSDCSATQAVFAVLFLQCLAAVMK